MNTQHEWRMGAILIGGISGLSFGIWYDSGLVAFGSICIVGFIVFIAGSLNP